MQIRTCEKIRSSFLAFIVIAWTSPAIARQIASDQFDSLNWDIWCPCQMMLEGESKLEFLEEDGNHFARITMAEGNLGGNKCRKSLGECVTPDERSNDAMVSANDAKNDADRSAELPEQLGPSLITPLPPEPPSNLTITDLAPHPNGGPFCSDEKRAEGLAKNEEIDTPCVQRQELRLQDARMRRSDVPLLYSFRFRMPSKVPDTTHSVRWVTAQWKQEPATQPPPIISGEPWGPSPFLAQRFDDGILNVTVQDQECRCLVAAAEHKGGPDWTEKPQRCFSVRTGALEGGECSADLRAEYGSNPFLPNARGDWVTMRYRVQAGRNGAGLIEVYDDRRLVVRVTGSIGYDEASEDPSYTKFKIGQYQDYMPGSNVMDVDWFELETIP